MNEAGRNALRAAALAGVRQIYGALRDGQGGRCGIGVLADCVLDHQGIWGVIERFDLVGRAPLCPLCGKEVLAEFELVAHLNDWHGLDFLGIAEKMPVSPEP